MNTSITHHVNDSKDVIIIGAGIVGICCALSLLKRGVNVRLLDKQGLSEAASYGNAGVISPWSCVPQSLPGLWKSIPGMLLDPQGPARIGLGYWPKLLPWSIKFLRAGKKNQVKKIADAMQALNSSSIAIYRDHLTSTGQNYLLQDSWYIHAYRDTHAATLASAAMRLRIERGASIEIIDGSVLREIEPALSTDYQAAALIKNQARALDPGKLGKALAEKARQSGVIFSNTSVHSLTPTSHGCWQINTDQEPLTASHVVIAAGAESTQLLEKLGIKLPLEYERGYHLEFHDPGVTLNHSIMDVDRKFVTSSMLGGIRSAGTSEFVGRDAPPNYQRAQMLQKLTKNMLPDLHIGKTSQWMGVRPSFPDNLPCLGQLPDYNRLFAAFGHSHYGMSMAPKTGEIIADMITDTTPDIDLKPFQAERYL